MKKLVVQQVGIGDLIIFLSDIFQNLEKDEIVEIDFSYECINAHFHDPDGYHDFLTKLTYFLIPEDRIEVKRGLDGDKISIESIFDRYRRNSLDFKYLNSRNKIDIVPDPSSIVLNTKIRPLPRVHFDQIKDNFFKILNEGNKDIILIGEKTIEYGKLYQPNNRSWVFSAYDDYIKYLDHSKVKDLTMEKYGETPLDFNNLKKDIKIIASHKNICFGTSGAFSLTSCFSEVISYSLNDALSNFFDRKKQVIRTNSNIFLNDLKSFIK